MVARMTNRKAVPAGIGIALGSALLLSVVPTTAYAIDQASETEGAADVLADRPEFDRVNAEPLLDLIDEPAAVVDGTAISAASVTELPSANSDSLEYSTLDGKASMSIDIPDATHSASTDSASILEGTNGESYIAQASESGGLQILNVATRPTEEHSFDVNTTIPEGSEWATTASGSLELRNVDGDTIAAIDVPWSVDAAGEHLPTYFTVDGGLITQHVDTNQATFPVVSDPDIWWVIGTAAMCAVEIAGISVAAAKVVSVFAKADKLIKSTKAIVSAYNALGGKVDKVITLLKKYMKSKTSLTKSQITSLEKLIRAVGLTLFGWLGLGNCYNLITGR